jgi:hypothetical protein
MSALNNIFQQGVLVRSLILAVLFLLAQHSFAEGVSKASNAEGFRNVLFWEKSSTPVSFEYLQGRVFKGACFGAEVPDPEPVTFLTTSSRLKDENLGPAMVKTENKVLIGSLNRPSGSRSASEVRYAIVSSDQLWKGVLNSISETKGPAVIELEFVRGEVRLNGPYLVLVLRATADLYEKYSSEKNPKPVLKKGGPGSACYFYEELK